MKLVLPIAALLVLSRAPTSDASTLVLEGYKLQETNRDTSDFLYGGSAGVSSYAGSCSYVTYYDRCESAIAPGRSYERQWINDDTTTSYILMDDTVISCTRSRTDSACHHCLPGFSCTSTTSTTYSGSIVTYSIVRDYGGSSIASLPLYYKPSDGCSDVCTSDGSLYSPSGQSCPSLTGGWLVVNDDYDDTCAVQDTCEELVVKEGCEGSYMGSVAGTYRPYTADWCTDDQSRTQYYSQSLDKYLFHSGNGEEWQFSSFCSDYFTTNVAYFDGGDEPYLNAEDRIQCYDGGYTSNKNYDYTDFSIECKKKSGSGLPGKGLSTGNGGPESAAWTYQMSAGAKIMSLVAIVVVRFIII